MYYYLSPGISIINKKDDEYLFKSDLKSIKLEGASAHLFVEEILLLLTGKNNIDDLCAQLKKIDRNDLEQHLANLEKMGILKSNLVSTSPNDSGLSQPYANFLELVGRNITDVREKLATVKIAIIGLDAPGTQTLFTLQQFGFSNFKLFDPGICNNDYLNTFPFLKAHNNNNSKQECLSNYLKTQIGITIETGPGNLSQELLEECLAGCSMFVVCAGKGFPNVPYWVNQISLNTGKPAIYCSVKGHMNYIGPLVVPGKTACYTCHKMRNIALQDDVEEAMRYEELSSSNNEDSFYNSSFLPSSSNLIASVISSEVMKYFLNIGDQSLPAKIFEFNTITFENKSHSVLQKPDCNCQKKKIRQYPPLADLENDSAISSIENSFDKLISSYSGVIKEIGLIPKDISEPRLPLVFYADLANFSYLSKEKFDKYKINCSGKGMNVTSAKISTVGEAVERYSSSVYSPGEIYYESYNSIKDLALDPVALVLYLPHQYERLPLSVYDSNAKMGWIKGYSLVKDHETYVPAQAAFLNYSPVSKDEIILETSSNGIATGSCMLHAVLSAALEVIERDAFIIAWYNELQCKRVDPLKHPDKEIVDLCKSYERRGVEMHLYQLPTDTPCHVFLGIGVQRKGDGPAIVVGLGCDFSAAKAAKSALLEIGQVRPALKQRLRTVMTKERIELLMKDRVNVTDIEDHSLFYAIAAKLSAFDFIFSNPISDFSWDDDKRMSAKEKLSLLLSYCKNEKTDFVYVNLTPPDMEKMGLYTVKAIIPDFQPIHFGSHNIHLGGKRLYTLPQKLGLKKNESTYLELNKNPHPLT